MNPKRDCKKNKNKKNYVNVKHRNHYDAKNSTFGTLADSHDLNKPRNAFSKYTTLPVCYFSSDIEMNLIYTRTCYTL